jgi:hypothetical protein
MWLSEERGQWHFRSDCRVDLLSLNGCFWRENLGVEKTSGKNGGMRIDQALSRVHHGRTATLRGSFVVLWNELLAREAFGTLLEAKALIERG